MNIKLFTIVLLFMFNHSVFALPTTKVTIKVTDEAGVPIEGAKMSVILMSPKGQGEGWGTVSSQVTGVTDSDGLFSGEGKTQAYVSFSATKEGYYGSSGSFDKFTGVSGFPGFRKYEPWNPTVELVLKKIINPISMYAVRMPGGQADVYPEIPVLGRFVGYDLIANDWVAPHGLGTHRDFLFKVDIARSNSNQDYDVTLTLKFSNQGDGLIKYTPDISKGKSRLRLPHRAPVSGYTDELVHHYERTPGVISYPGAGNPDYDINYFFRVRTEMDKEGNVIGGLYGKLHSDINLHNYTLRIKDKNPFLSFNYYLNPNNNDTNIEYDLEKNLFKGVPDQRKVINP